MAGRPELSRAARASLLEKAGTTFEFVLLDLHDAAKGHPGLQDELDRCETDEERWDLAVDWFKDHPQPTERSNWVDKWTIISLDDPSLPPTFRTPDWPGGWRPGLTDEQASDELEEYGPWPRVKAEKAARLRAETRRGRTWIASEVDWSERQVGYLIDLLDCDPPALTWDEERGLRPGTGWDTRGVPDGRSIIVRRSRTA